MALSFTRFALEGLAALSGILGPQAKWCGVKTGRTRVPHVSALSQPLDCCASPQAALKPKPPLRGAHLHKLGNEWGVSVAPPSTNSLPNYGAI